MANKKPTGDEPGRIDGKKQGRRALTKKEKRLVEALPVAETHAEAAVIAGYSDKNPRQSAFQALQSIKEKMPELMDRLGLTDDVLIDKYLRPGLEADRREHFANGGIVMETRVEPDTANRRMYLDMAFKLRGSYQQKVEIDVNHSFTLDLGDASDDDILAVLSAATRRGRANSAGPQGGMVSQEPIDVAAG